MLIKQRLPFTVKKAESTVANWKHSKDKTPLIVRCKLPGYTIYPIWGITDKVLLLVNMKMAVKWVYAAIRKPGS